MKDGVEVRRAERMVVGGRKADVGQDAALPSCSGGCLALVFPFEGGRARYVCDGHVLDERISPETLGAVTPRLPSLMRRSQVSQDLFYSQSNRGNVVGEARGAGRSNTGQLYVRTLCRFRELLAVKVFQRVMTYGTIRFRL